MYKGINKKFFKKWSPEMAYVLGFIMADGSIDIGNRGNYYFSIAITDGDLLKEIKNLLQSEHKISLRKGIGNHKDSYKIQIGSKEMCKDLKTLGITENKSFNMTLPDIPKKYIPDLIRGYFDGDGMVYFNKHFAKDRNKMRWVFMTSFTCAIDSFLRDLHRLLKKESGIKGGFIVRKSKRSGYELKFSYRDSLELYKYMYNNGLCPVCLIRKKVVFQKAFKELGY